MGVLDTLSEFNEDVEEATDTALDNEEFSVQDNTRGALMEVTGYESDEKFAEASVKAYEGAKDEVTDPVSHAIEGTPADNQYVRGAGRGVETAGDLFVGYPAKVAYGSATGVNTFTENPEQASTEYSPDAMDTAEVGLIALTGGTGRVAAKGATRGVRTATKVAKTGDNMGILGGIARVAKKLRYGDEAVDSAKAGTAGSRTTRASLDPAYAKRYSKNPENLATPSALKNSDEATSIADALPGGKSLQEAAAAARSRGIKKTDVLIGGGAAALGAVGLADASALPDGYEKDHQYTRGPGAIRVRQFDADGSTLGYWVVLQTDGSSVTVLDSSGVAYQTNFPADTNAPFDSPQQADTAYERFVANQENTGEDTPAYEDRKQPQQNAWGGAEALRPLDYGWYLVEQKHNQEDKYRYFVTAKDANGRLIYVGPSGTTRRDAPPHATVEKATAAYDKWVRKARNGNVSMRPDTAQDWPRMDDIVQDARNHGRDSTSGGVLSGSSVKIAVGGSLAAVVVALIYKVVL